MQAPCSKFYKGVVLFFSRAGQYGKAPLAAAAARVPLEDVKDEGGKSVWMGYTSEGHLLAGTHHRRKAGPCNTLGV